MSSVMEEIPDLFSFITIRQPQSSHEKIRILQKNIHDKQSIYCMGLVLEKLKIRNGKLYSNFAPSIN